MIEYEISDLERLIHDDFETDMLLADIIYMQSKIERLEEEQALEQHRLSIIPFDTDEEKITKWKNDIVENKIELEADYWAKHLVGK